MDDPTVFLLINLILIPLLEGAVIGWSLGALTMQAASALGGVEELGYFKAGVMTTLLAVINVPISLGVYYLVVRLGIGKGTLDVNTLFWAEILGLLGQLFLSGAILCLVLHVSYSKGVWIALLQFFITVIFLAVLVGLVLVVVAILQISYPAKV